MMNRRDVLPTLLCAEGQACRRPQCDPAPQRDPSSQARPTSPGTRPACRGAPCQEAEAPAAAATWGNRSPPTTAILSAARVWRYRAAQDWPPKTAPYVSLTWRRALVLTSPLVVARTRNCLILSTYGYEWGDSCSQLKGHLLLHPSPGASTFDAAASHPPPPLSHRPLPPPPSRLRRRRTGNEGLPGFIVCLRGGSRWWRR